MAKVDAEEEDGKEIAPDAPATPDAPPDTGSSADI